MSIEEFVAIVPKTQGVINTCFRPRVPKRRCLMKMTISIVGDPDLVIEGDTVEELQKTLLKIYLKGRILGGINTLVGAFRSKQIVFI
jgi:hypothetical protein